MTVLLNAVQKIYFLGNNQIAKKASARSYFVPMENRTMRERIRYVRRHLLGLSQEQLAGELGVKRGAVTNWERGGGISRENLAALAALANVSTDWLSGGAGAAPMARAIPFEEIIAATIQVTEKLRKSHWSEGEIQVLAEKIREFCEEQRSDRESRPTEQQRLALDIRRALRERIPKN